MDAQVRRIRMNKSNNCPASTRTAATCTKQLICVLASILLMLSPLVYTCQASECPEAAASSVQDVNFWTNVPEQWDCWENTGFGRRHTIWRLDPASKQVMLSYAGIGSLMGSNRLALHVENFDGHHIVFTLTFGAYRGVFEGDVNGKGINGTVAWPGLFTSQKHKWSAQWTGGESWPVQTTVSNAQATGSSAQIVAQPLQGRIQFSSELKESHTSLANTKLSVPRVRKGELDTQLKIQYPEHYPFPLVAIRFPADYSDTFVDAVSRLQHFQTEKIEIITELVNEQVIKSTYSACQLYEYLKTRLPENTVVLVPCKLQTDSLGKVVNCPIGKPLPAVVQLDLFSWINIGRLKKLPMYLAQPDTFADRGRTWVSMSMPIARNRQLFAGQPVIASAGSKMGQGIESYYNINPNGGRWSEFKVRRQPVPMRCDQLSDGQFMVIHQDFRYRREDLALEASATKEDVEPAAKEQLRYYGNLVINALNSQNLEQIKSVLLAEYVDDIAPDLSHSLSVPEKLSEPNLDKQRRYFDHCLAAMREQLLSKETESVANTIYAGDFGQQFRTAVNAEMEYRQEQVSALQREVGAAILCGAALGGAVGATVIGSSAAGMFTSVAAASASIVCKEHKLKKQLRSNFLKVWNESNNAQASCLLKLDNDVIEIRGDGVEAFRKSIKEGYEKRFGITGTI